MEGANGTRTKTEAATATQPEENTTGRIAHTLTACCRCRTVCAFPPVNKHHTNHPPAQDTMRPRTASMRPLRADQLPLRVL